MMAFLDITIGLLDRPFNTLSSLTSTNLSIMRFSRKELRPIVHLDIMKVFIISQPSSIITPRDIMEFETRYQSKLRVILDYQEELAQSIYAGGDIFLMPSRFEPCGIAQMIAMRYGNIPIVRETGGLKDTVKPYSLDSGEGNGFTFTHYNAHAFLYAVQRAVNMFLHQKEAWEKLQRNALSTDFSWRQSAEQYREVYESLYY